MNRVVVGIDADHARAVPLAEVPHGGYRPPRADFNHGQFLQGGKPPLKQGHLAGRPRFNPVPVAEHQDIGSRHRPASGTARQRRQQAAIRLVDVYAQVIGRPKVTAARVGTLEPVNRAVALHNPFIRETGLLEMTVHVAREHEGAALHPLSPCAEDAVAAVWNCASVEIEPVSVEAPGALRVMAKRDRVGDILEVDTFRL